MSFYNLKKNWGFVALGAGLLFVLMVVPVVSKPVVGLVAKVRDMIGGK